MLLPKLNTPGFFARMLLLYAEFDWRTVRNWKDLRSDPETGDVLTFATMAKNCGLLLDHKTAELTLGEVRTQQLLTPYRSRVLFCSVRCCLLNFLFAGTATLSLLTVLIQSHGSFALQTGLPGFSCWPPDTDCVLAVTHCKVICCISSACMQVMAAYSSGTEPAATLRSEQSVCSVALPSLP